MCLLKRLKNINKKLDGVANSQLELTQIIKSEELEKLRRKEKKLDDLISSLSHIRLKVNNCASYVDQNTNKVCVRVSYTLPDIILNIEDGKVVKNNSFISINSLDLISLDDMNRVIEEINKAKKL